ncbi:MAG: hypothetical protein RLZZ440_2871 [Planctomycetota bacterium]
MHGLIFFYLQKFLETLSTGAASGSHAPPGTVAGRDIAAYLPSNVYPDADAVGFLEALAGELAEPLTATARRFGEFLAPHLVKVAGPLIDPSWRTLDLIEHTEDLIHAMVRTNQPGADPPVLETVRSGPQELHLVYSSRRRLCPLATGLLHGLARHYGETLDLDETSCMLRGDPFCSFVVRVAGHETHACHSPITDTVIMSPGSSTGSMSHDPGLLPESNSLADDPLPASVGGYRVLGLIGSGAMGRVYLAHDEQLDRNVAIKVMNRRRARDSRARQRFLREGRTAAAIDHPHVLMVHAVGEQDGLPFIVMQLLEGRNLGEKRAEAGTLPLGMVLRIGREIAEGLAAAHARGLIHRDIKPDNIFLDGPLETVRIIDFGLAGSGVRQAESSARLTVDGGLVGTPAYMPPERLEDESLDAQSDLFGLGVMLYELLTGRLPFEGETMVAMLASIARGQPRPLSEAAPEIPPPVCEVVMRLIAHRREDRPESATIVARELGRLERAFADP